MSHRLRHALETFSLSLLAAATLAACTGDDDTPPPPPGTETAPAPQAPAPERTPISLRLERIGGYATNLFGKSAAEIPAYDPSKRAFVVNADAGAVDVLDLANPATPISVGRLDSQALLAGSEINSVGVRDGVVAVAIQASPKTDKGRVALARPTLRCWVASRSAPCSTCSPLPPTARRCWCPTKASRTTITRSTPRARSA